MIRGDSTEYDLLEKWCTKTPLYDSQRNYHKTILTCEIGVREGLGSKVIMDTFSTRLKFKDAGYKHIGIDPYANLDYQHYDDSGSYTADYTETMRCQLQKDFSSYEQFDLFHMTDVDFMNRYHDYGPFHFVHFDGPHMTKDVMTEAVWFANRSIKGTRFVFDDYTKYNMALIAKVLGYYGFSVVESGKNKCLLEKNV